MTSERVDVVIVGAGPAGLTAALYLARAGKKTLVVDDELPRNAAVPHAHGMIGFDHRPPGDIRAAGREALARYPAASLRKARVASIERDGPDLSVMLADGKTLSARRVLLATGLRDTVPDEPPGLRERWGASVFGCAYCHGHEHAGETWGVLLRPRAVARLAPLYRGWTDHVIALLDGRTDHDAQTLAALRARGIEIEPRRIVALHGPDRSLTEIELEGGERLPMRAFVAHPPLRQADLVLMLGLALDAEGSIKVGEDHSTSMRGVYACGDSAGSRPHAVVAAADGATAGMDLVESLTLADLPRP